jgi:hypothetical protein
MKKFHLLLGISLFLFLYLYMNIESFGNPFDKPFSYQQNNNKSTGFKNQSICRDDTTWKNKEKSCKDYSISGANCSDIGDNGIVAFDACRVACDNCPKSVEIKIREPSPTADYIEPSYSTFEGPQGEFISESGIDTGSADFREIFMKLGEIEEKIGMEYSNDIPDEYCISSTDTNKEFNDTRKCILVSEEYDDDNNKINTTGCCTKEPSITDASLQCHYVSASGQINEDPVTDCGS